MTHNAQDSASLVSPQFSRREWLQATAAATLVPSVLSTACQAEDPAVAPNLAPDVVPNVAPLGLNLAPVKYWMAERPFNNLFATASPWVPLKDGGTWNDGGELQLDERGWIKQLRAGQHAAFMIDLGRGHPNATYEVRGKGRPQWLQVSGFADNRFVKREPGVRLLVRVHGPVREVAVQEAANRDTDTFYQPFVERCAKFKVLRFMEWSSTNDDRELAWEDRTTVQHPTQADREVALEHQVSLCNLTRAGMWYCVHHRADDDYVRQVARFLKATLQAELPLYLEHSNEVWNGVFPQAKYCQSQSRDFLDYHVRRTAEIARIFRQEKLAVVSVLGLQSVHLGAAAQVLTARLPAEINATAIAPYFGGEVVSDESRVAAVLKQGVDYVLKQCRLDLERCRQDIRRHRELTAQRGLQLLAYEGGQHLVAGYPFRDNPQLVDLLVAANRHPEMYDLYRDYLTIWAQESRGGLMCLFNSCMEPGIYGSWGLLEYEGQPLEQAHKMRAVLDHMMASS